MQLILGSIVKFITSCWTSKC